MSAYLRPGSTTLHRKPVFDLPDPRVLLCGSRGWSWPATVHAILDRLAARHDDRLVVIEGHATGADEAAHTWCAGHRLPVERHRCHPVDWVTARRTRPRDWRSAGPERNTRMLVNDQPRLIVACHDRFDPATGGTSDMALRGLLRAVPVWLLPGPDLTVGRWLSLDVFPRARIERVDRQLAAATRPAGPARRPDLAW